MIEEFSPYIFGGKEICTTVSVEDYDDHIMEKFVQVPIELTEQPLPTEESYRIMLEERSEFLLLK